MGRAVVMRVWRGGGLAALAASLSARGPTLAAVAFLALAGRAALDLRRAVVESADLPRPGAAAAPRASPALQADLSAIRSGHLFGQALTAEHDAPPPTRAALVLGGVWYSPAGNAYALIGEPGTQQKPYRTGDRLPGGVDLAGIEVDQVLLRRDGQTETLALPRVAPPKAGGRRSTAPLMVPAENP